MVVTTQASTRQLDDAEVEGLDRWWRAANYLAVGQIYLMGDDPLLTRPLAAASTKPRLLGHWGTTPGLNLLWAHASRCVRERDLEAIFVTGPGHGGPAVVASTWLEGTWTDVYPDVSRDAAGMGKLFRQFSFPGGIPSHVAADVPGSIHEGGELGYSLAHAHGAAFDDPGLVVFCVVGDGEAETGPLAGSWQSVAFVDAARDGAVLPVLHLNGWKIANPTTVARLSDDDLVAHLGGRGYAPVVVEGPHEGETSADVHRRLAAALDGCLDGIAAIQARARGRAGDDDHEVVGTDDVPRWPLLVLRTPKGWTGPAEVDGERVEGTWRAHQVPISEVRGDDENRRRLEEWMRSYRPEELFDADGRPQQDLLDLVPRRPMSANPRTNGGSVSRPLRLADFRDHAVEVRGPGETMHSPTTVLGDWLARVAVDNPTTFRLFGPDEVASNRLQAVVEAVGRAWAGKGDPDDDRMRPSGRVMEVLSEHLVQGWLEGYLLTGRHGVLTSYEAFVHIVDSMLNQHAKWLKVTRQLPWRDPLPSLNYLLSSHVWRQDHNGFSHQDPGFLDHVATKKAEISRIYLPPDANTLLSTMDHVLRSEHYVNVVVAGKQMVHDYLPVQEAVEHCARGLGIWDWASSDEGEEPDVVVAAAGDVPTLEALAAVDLLRTHLPRLRVRFVNVVDLMRLQSASEHPHGMPDAEFDAVFTRDRPVVMAFHGYPALVHRLTYRRANNGGFHVRGFVEEGTTTTPFDMVSANDMDRFRLAADVLERVPGLLPRHAALRQRLMDARRRAREHAYEHGEDPEEISGWRWPHGGVHHAMPAGTPAGRGGGRPAVDDAGDRPTP
ncbi:xylulose-5-phosphate/fructose-6-phosphate phosphoketolase [Pseudokineococcus lusitanus]|uniref:Xylulose-5-phosphate/fructose-6-phosphate phosphoketolase n=1 Tax=Pseudokineococcus lusitanus TaxID=763993 RepID=A0A3N1HNE4_9ACTN|nr:phosphoketolase family protein [Pseudokineococcus lusitanus]ROP43892.1 xylulose-5-phosphate/fructose-6-phosphate phosphoketolase [Pseudokineococcus lusitanus]